MILLLALAVAVLFGAGAFLLLERDLVRVTGGAVLMSQSANLFLVAVGLTRGAAPVLPVADPAEVSDPLAQALALTSVVISFGIAALLLGLVLRVYATHGTIDIGEVEEREVEAEEREEEGADEGEGSEEGEA
ncbi:MAG TPA: NADH-quinone oxidoreductase subunit K [Thermoanaerobaculia bacterium]|nr:NADH-quinone oxidoreductase subunit K [Thermoanaerobaculia bacterium]